MRMTRSRSWMLLATLALPACMADVASEPESVLEDEGEELAGASEALVATTTYAATGGRSDSVTQLFGIGRHRASLGDFATLGDNRLTRLTLPPASRARICRNEGTNGGGELCQIVTNPTTSPTPWFTVTLGDVSLLDIEPLAIAFRNTGFSGVSEHLTYGEHRAINGQFATVGNDLTKSVYIPPGVRVRLCSDENGVGGHGTNRCKTYDESISDVSDILGVSYADVLPVVTAFEQPNLLGQAQSFSPGAFLASFNGMTAIGNDRISSVAIPHILNATICKDDFSNGTGGGGCSTFTRSMLTLPSLLDNQVSYINVQPFHLGTRTVSVTVQAGTSSGAVTTNPYGFTCRSGTCSASYHARSTVRLTAYPASGAKAVWTGCDSVSSNVCSVYAENARSVSVRFDVPTCYEQCVSSCPTKEPFRSECLDPCWDECD